MDIIGEGIEMKNKDKLWFPEPYQIHTGKNPDYLHSLFIGLTNPLWNLPTMIFIMILKPVLMSVFYILLFIFRCTALGVIGHLGSKNTPPSTVRFVVLSKDDDKGE